MSLLVTAPGLRDGSGLARQKTDAMQFPGVFIAVKVKHIQCRLDLRHVHGALRRHLPGTCFQQRR